MNAQCSFLGLIRDWQWYSDTFMVRLFMHLIITANNADTLWRGTTLPRATLATSITALRAETGMSRKRIRTCLDRLIECGEITVTVQGRFTLVTMTRYDIYCRPETPTEDHAGCMDHDSNPASATCGDISPADAYTVDGHNDIDTFITGYVDSRSVGFYNHYRTTLKVTTAELHEHIRIIVQSWRDRRLTFDSTDAARCRLERELTSLIPGRKARYA